MAEPLDPKFLDKRTAERYLKNGQLEEKAYERFIKSLPDVVEKATLVETTMADAEEDEVDEDDDEDSGAT